MNAAWLVSYGALWLLLFTMAVVLMVVVRNLGIVYGHLKAISPVLMPAGTDLTPRQVLPEITVETLGGKLTSLSSLRGAKYAIDLVSPSCEPCLAYLKEIVSGDRDPDSLDPTVRLRVIISLGDLDATRGLFEAVKIPDTMPVLVDTNRQVADKWGIRATPSSVIVDEELRVVRQFLGGEAHHVSDTSIPVLQEHRGVKSRG
jgi:thiol-disulfide isomerase/thioredoxin